MRRGPRFTVLIREDLKVQPFADVITKAAVSPQLCKDPDCWSGRGLNLRSTGWQSGALLTELTSQRSSSVEEIRSSVCTVNLISRVVCAEHTPSGP